MQFGHNDGGPIVGGTGRASLKGVGDESQEVLDPKTNQNVTVHTYGWYMSTYIDDAKAKGATPIIVSPIPRDIWSADGKTVNRNTNDYGGWSKQVAATENIPFVDLNAIVADKYDQLGFPAVKAAYFPGDHTHTSPAGAELNAECVVQGLKALPNDPLAAYLLPNAPILQSAAATASP
jgi:rhamnogalacturonan acetylesterase